MATTTEYRTYGPYESRAPRMSSRLIILVAIVFALLWGLVDIFWHGHFSDARYKRYVEDVLLDSRYNTPDRQNIKVDVKDRWVSLSGIVPSQEDMDRISELVTRQIPGLDGISNNLRVATSYCEQQVIERLRDLVGILPNDPKISYLTDDDCNVTLTGWVPTQEMKDKIEAVVTAAPGVRSVKNDIEVGSPKRKIEDILIEILRVQNIYFDHNSANIRKESLTSISKIAAVLKEHADIRIRIEGHTDSVDSEEYNLRLSQERAEAVKRALEKEGIASDRMEAQGFGESRPIAPNTTPEGRAENRRIEFHVL